MSNEEPVDADTEYLLLRSERVRRTMRMRRAGGAGEGAAPLLPLQQGLHDSLASPAAASHRRPSAATLASTTAALGGEIMQPSPTSDELGNGGSGGTPSKASTRRASSGGGGGGGGTGSRTEQLAERISDEFLTCKICEHTYTSPKCLTCMHSFCEDCIERQVNAAEASYKSKYSDYREFACPLCRKRTQLPLGGARKLPDNFLLSSLHEVIRMQRPSKMPYCDICRTVSKRVRDAAAKCIDCSKLLCSGCVQQHRDTKITRNHSVFDVEVEKDIHCAVHDDEVVRFYCEPCERCVCVLCTFADEHRGHEISQFGDAVQRYKTSIDALLRSCKERLAEYERHVESVGRCEAVARQAEDKIRQCAADMIGQIRTRERQLLEELRNAYGADAMALVERRADLQATLDGLKSACSLTELLLSGKGVELLLLKKDVADKLAALSHDAVLLPRQSGGVSSDNGEQQRLPATIGKTIKFVPGIVDLGYLHDMDRPLLTRRRFRRALTSSLDYRSPTDDDEFCEGGSFDFNFDFTAAPPAPPLQAVKSNIETRYAETQTPTDAAGAKEGSGANGRGVGIRSVDASVMTDRWTNRPATAVTCEQSVQVSENDQPRRYGARTDDIATSYSSAVSSGGGTAHDAPSSATDGVITRRRRRIDRTRTTANVENVEYTSRAAAALAADGEEAGDGGGGSAEARAARRQDATTRTARRFHLDSGRLRRYKSFEDDGQASAYI